MASGLYGFQKLGWSMILQVGMGAPESSTPKRVGGWTNPSEKYARQNGFIFPKVRGENKQYLSCHHLVRILGTLQFGRVNEPI